MQLLNKTFTPTSKVRSIFPDAPHYFTTWAGRFALDANSLAVASLTADEDLRMRARPFPPGIVFCCPFQPVEHRQLAEPLFLILNVAADCNLTCSYCFRDKNPGQRRMTCETVERALVLVPNIKHIGFFGGEPLLNFGAIRWAVNHAPAGTHFHLTTNGTLITPDHARYLAEHKFSVLLSLDGPRNIHNASRSDSFDSAMQGLVRLACAGVIPLTLRATYHPGCLRFIERVSFFWERLISPATPGSTTEGTALAQSFSLEPAALRPGECWNEKKLEAEYEALSHWLLEHPEMLRRYFGYQAMSKRILEGKPYVYNCGAGNRYITVAANGDIHACHREASPIGHVFAGGFDKRRDDWIVPTTASECNNCWARYLCGGGCRASWLYEEGPQQCVPTKILIKETISMLWELQRDKQHDAPAPDPGRGCSRY